MESIQEHLKKYTKSKAYKQRYHDLMMSVLQDEEVQQFISMHQKELTEQMLDIGHAKLYEFVKEKERMAVSGQSQNPGFLPKLVLTSGYIDVVYEATKEFLQQEEQRLVAQRIQTLEMPKNIGKTRLSQIDQVKNRLPILKALVAFVNDYQDNSSKYHKGLYLYGAYGVGKTYLLGALAGELALKGYSSYLAHFPSLVVELKAAIGQNRVNEKLDIIKKAPILMLDDIGGETMTAWVRDDILMTILDYRMRQQLPTFFTSNLSFELLEDHLKGVNIEDERKAKRLMERIKYLSIDMKMTGENRRV